MLTEPKALAEMLGLHDAGDRRTATSFQLIASIEQGLPVASVDRLASALAPTDADFKHRFVPRATLARRRKQDAPPRLTREEGDLVARIAGVWAHALEVWKDEDAARAFLFRPHPMLEGQRPIDTAFSTRVGADLVDQILGRLAYGSAV